MSKLNLAERYYQECKEKKIHFKDVPKYLENILKNEEEEVVDAIELYIRYNLYDRRLTDKDIIYAKEFLSSK